ncbi:rhodanese-like domain-containing protein [Chryseosolibacter indicus]|uniref:Rhodanese-like domain-containing protein n=1 Tax=Chryseosolibacter indicus TaxID=2782351 RepID=A0ABS5VTF1_9BACT|nr:rhodanese-like domain-containing protein [Chryseosolibacter indicus]MBT1704697.1 rhodanese-like domain-containing protein [Chryseosolibacter indicus]
MKTFVFISILVAASVTAFSQGNVISEDLTAEQFKTKLESKPGAVLLDLRTPDELKKGMLPHAVQIDYFNKNFEDQIRALDKNKVYFIYCAGGGRSGETKELMAKEGFKEVYNLPEGFDGWKKKKMPIQE